MTPVEINKPQEHATHTVLVVESQSKWLISKCRGRVPRLYSSLESKANLRWIAEIKKIY